jgi:hypothetical protein
MEITTLQHGRCRHWHSQVIDPRELEECAVFVARSTYEGNSLRDALREVAPWFSLWRDHELWRTGTWVCKVDDAKDLGGRRMDLLPFHTDMSRYMDPPHFVAIRCVAPDSHSTNGGTNFLLHSDDIRNRLKTVGRYDILEVLERPRPLNLRNGERPLVCMLSAEMGGGPVRMFDPNMATKGDHLELSPSERNLIATFLALCQEWTDLAVKIRLDAGDWVVFSNHTFLHSRSACHGLGRITEVCLGNYVAADSR